MRYEQAPGDVGPAGAWGAVFLAEGKTSPRAVRQKPLHTLEVRLPGWPRAECLQSRQAGYKPREVEEQTVESLRTQRTLPFPRRVAGCSEEAKEMIT